MSKLNVPENYNHILFMSEETYGMLSQYIKNRCVSMRLKPKKK